MRSARALFLLGLAIAGGNLAAVATCDAQVFVPRRGEGSFTLNQEYLRVDTHLFSSDLGNGLDVGDGVHTIHGNRADMGKIRSYTVDAGVDYGLTSRLAASADVAYITSRYRGLLPEGPLDNGNFHGAVQDVHIGARFALLRAPFAVTPTLDYEFPTHAYSVLGHSVIGRHLNTLRAGVGIARDLHPWLPAAYVEAHYEHGFVENMAGFSLDNNVIGIDAGYSITPELSVRAFGSHLSTVDGIDWLTDLATPEGMVEHFDAHDVAAKERRTVVGGGAGYDVTARTSFFLNVVATVAGGNTHAGTGFNLGTNWNFGR